MEDVKAAVKRALEIRSEQDRLPPTFRNEIEVAGPGEDGDPITRAAVDLAVVDLLREQDGWDRLDKEDPAEDPDIASEATALFSRPEFRLAVATCTLADDSQTMTAATLRIAVAFKILTDLEREFPDAASRMLSVVEDLVSASYSVAKSATLARHERQSGHIRSLSRVNADKEALKARARKLAQQHWDTDTCKQLSVIDVANAVRDDLLKEGVLSSELGKAEAIKKWLSPTSPDYARKPGRRPY